MDVVRDELAKSQKRWWMTTVTGNCVRQDRTNTGWLYDDHIDLDNFPRVNCQLSGSSPAILGSEGATL